MVIRLNPYIHFDGNARQAMPVRQCPSGNARQAMEFYESVFGGTLTLSTFAEIGGLDGEKGKEIMHGMLSTDNGLTIMAADGAPGSEHKRGNDFSVSLSGENADGNRLREYWQKLSADGNVTVALETQMWGDEFGMCTDAFGINWMVNIAK